MRNSCCPLMLFSLRKKKVELHITIASKCQETHTEVLLPSLPQLFSQLEYTYKCNQ